MPPAMPLSFGRRRYSGICPPSNPEYGMEPLRLFCPRMPIPHEPPCPAPYPRPMRLRSLRLPGCGAMLCRRNRSPSSAARVASARLPAPADTPRTCADPPNGSLVVPTTDIEWRDESNAGAAKAMDAMNEAPTEAPRTKLLQKHRRTPEPCRLLQDARELGRAWLTGRKAEAKHDRGT